MKKLIITSVVALSVTLTGFAQSGEPVFEGNKVKPTANGKMYEQEKTRHAQNAARLDQQYSQNKYGAGTYSNVRLKRKGHKLNERVAMGIYK